MKKTHHGRWSRDYALSANGSKLLSDALPSQPVKACPVLPHHGHLATAYSRNQTCCSWWHVPPWRLQPSAYYAAPMRFCVVRDPFTRLFSAYERTHRWVDGVNGSSLCQQIETKGAARFHEWVKFVAHWIDTGRLMRNDCHLLAQAEYLAESYVNISTLTSMDRKEAALILGSKGPGCNIVLRFEQLAVEFAQLMRWLELDDVKIDDDWVPRVSGTHGACLSAHGVRTQLLPASSAADNLTTRDVKLLAYPSLQAVYSS
jgi:hypothetical protein